MSSERVLRSRSVGVPSRIPRAIGVQIPNSDLRQGAEVTLKRAATP